MGKHQVGVLLLCAVLVSVGGWHWQSLHEPVAEAVQSGLAQTLSQCDLIASKAAASLPEQLPFQQLEKAARQSRVLAQCMQDRGYQENPAWVVGGNQQASRIASAEGISENEAYETLRRKAMLQADAQPNYWRKQP